MPQDAFGFPQPAPLSRVLIGARYASVAGVAGELLYLEVPLLGKLFQPGLPMPLRDNRMGLGLASPGTLGTTYALEIRCWGSDGGASGGNVALRVGALASIPLYAGGAVAQAFLVSAFITANAVGTFAIAVITVPGAGLRNIQTPPIGLDATVSLGLTLASGGVTIDGAEVWLTSVLGFPPQDSVVG